MDGHIIYKDVECNNLIYIINNNKPYLMYIQMDIKFKKKKI